MLERQYLCIDLKSFYASVECVERNLDPLSVNLVVADSSRTEKTICLAVTPPLKTFGISGRARLFEVVQKIEEINAMRCANAPGKSFSGESYDFTELKENPELRITYITAPPRMALYIRYSTEIYNVYLKYVAPEDIHVYSIDEVFIDVTNYLDTYKLSARALAKRMIQDVMQSTGITATAGIGTNLYLAKVAMDIMAKRIVPDSDGVRIAELDEMSYRRELWNHSPITDFWRVGRGYAKKLEERYIYTMGDIARCSTSYHGEKMLYRLFGVNAELLIDHAWGWESCRMEDIKAYKPENKSIGSGQVLPRPYTFEKARLVVREMAELLVLDLVEKRVCTDQLVLTVGYDEVSMKGEKEVYSGEFKVDFYGRKVPKPTHGTINVDIFTCSSEIIVGAVVGLFDKITDRTLFVRRINISANHIVDVSYTKDERFEQLNLFSNESIQNEKKNMLSREKQLLEITVYLRRKFGKNSILRGYNLCDGATAIERNRQIGGHKA